MLLLDGLGSAVNLLPAAGENLHIDDNPFDSMGNTQRGIPNIPGLFPEDGPQEFLLRRELCLSLGGNLANEDVPGRNQGPQSDNPALIQVLQGLFPHVRNITGYLFLAEFRIPGRDLQFLDMDRGIDVLLQNLFAHKNGILEIVAPPGQKGYKDIPAQGQLSPICRGAIRDGLSLGYPLPPFDDGLLINAGVLIGTHKLDQGIYIQLKVTVPIEGMFDNNLRGIHKGYHTVTFRQDDDPRIPRHDPFHARSHEGGLRPQQRNGLALHVGTHQGPVGVIVFQKGDQRGGNGDKLFRRNVHEIHLFRGYHNEFPPLPRGDQVVEEASLFIKGSIGLGNDVILLVEGEEILYLTRGPAIFDHPIGGLDESVRVDPGKGAQGGNEPNVGTFRGLDGADPPVMCGMHIPNLKPRSLTGQPSGPQGAEAPLMGNLREGVDLIHELRKLAASEKLLQDGREGLGVDQVVRHQGLHVLEAHLFLDGPFEAHHSDVELILHQFPHRANPPVPEMIDIIFHPIAVPKAEKISNHFKDIPLRQGHLLSVHVDSQLVVELHPANL